MSRLEPAPCATCQPVLRTGSDQLVLFTEGDELYEAMLASIAGARKTVCLETYIFAADEVGWRFAEALAERAGRGVQVRLHLDAVGCLFRWSRPLEEHLRMHGVRLRWFHRWRWRSPLRYNRRNHRKLLVVDDDEAYVGGFNIHRENSRALVGDERWRDTHVHMRGGLARRGHEVFDTTWRGDHGCPAPARQRAVSTLVPNHSSACRRALRCLLDAAFSDARGTLYVTTPYFAPDRRTQRALTAAARRGADVRVLVPHRSDVRMARWAAPAAYADLLRHGVRVHAYLPRVLHAKTAVIDGNWGTVGTANFDYRSFFLNQELNLVSRDRDLCRRLQEQFYEDLSHARALSPEGMTAKPLARQASALAAWMARRWL
ncbi:MAG: phosphatidylserine/phosphatidylglycerophosphate/cardiolipin synthase family protein [Gammaproteobacteria bacterium]|nr:phosphatidylserine/phosphatidylglycerophosphate/cardiolipin synthase family protein [Gammaproteobacteria bacterium]NIR84345.1 phosphatidylserine/phosphatidylglycerophosphate/cardiolipin synthase family protein [Gammaproteobacteria bacterium]NIR89861.1 phosphatidylserine/phosphatidylglycerophosphate/cardiolipin synthase family protein [Gammaproteobacteria bacterium]NIU05728.1 phosphatidylserine/phosphatidylglycerophosphate/cardiolipin synthase family protein [Gammaproteobacteria bacterium]NIV